MIIRRYEDGEIRALYSDPLNVELRWLYNNYRGVFEVIEKRAVELGLTQPIQSGGPRKTQRSVTWEDPPFRGF